MEQLLSIDEAARKLGGLSKYTINAWLSKGILMRTKVGRRTMIRESELQRILRDGEKSPAPGMGAECAMHQVRQTPEKSEAA